jgi:hypothetical protein
MNGRVDSASSGVDKLPEIRRWRGPLPTHINVRLAKLSASSNSRHSQTASVAAVIIDRQRREVRSGLRHRGKPYIALGTISGSPHPQRRASVGGTHLARAVCRTGIGQAVQRRGDYV